MTVAPRFLRVDPPLVGHCNVCHVRVRGGDSSYFDIVLRMPVLRWVSLAKDQGCILPVTPFGVVDRWAFYPFEKGHSIYLIENVSDKERRWFNTAFDRVAEVGNDIALKHMFAKVISSFKTGKAPSVHRTFNSDTANGRFYQEQ